MEKQQFDELMEMLKDIRFNLSMIPWVGFWIAVAFAWQACGGAA